MKKRSNGSPMKKMKRKSFNHSPIPKPRMSKKGAHSEMSTPPTATSIPPGMSPSLVVASPVEMSTPPVAASTPLETAFTPQAAASTPLATLTQFSQLPYTSSAPTSTPSSASSAVGMLSRPAPSSSPRPPAPVPLSAPSLAPSSQGVVDSLILILPTADSFNKQSDYAKLITKNMKAHFVEAHLSLGKVLERIKNMWYTEFRISVYIMEVSMGPDT
ncbi:hypothetical protein M9H77_02947 [Catharanthus roseus]|uniref:Uncharacterized protein n=1 Tax=Catharanthus roseus TaxID=4058 RepID=A0ACC0CAA9_CATRO|nr:hypothetical protein M9H77_02947 [Catharanthus roseus]